MKANNQNISESTSCFPKIITKKPQNPVKISMVNTKTDNVVINLTESTDSLNNHGYSNSNLISSQQSSSPNSITTDNMKVVIRIRPPLSRETEKNLPFRSIVIANKENKTCSLIEYIGTETDEAMRQKEWIEKPYLFNQHKFTFDEVFDIDSTQEEVYTLAAKPAVQSVLEGYNSTIFAYGQTGTGKTFTMEGFTYDQIDNKKGIIPRTIENIFSFIESNSNSNTKFIIRAAYLQIYNEMISDLLVPNNGIKNLNIREDKKKGLYVEHLSEFAVRSANEIYLLLKQGASSRAFANTNMNDVSSRSHAVFMIIVEQMITNDENQGRQTIKTGKLNLVDLAGSERIKVTGATGKQLEESKKINKSLSALGNVINALTDPKKRGCHIPYRDSKLTRLLENSLGGNCKTTMIATISPAQMSFNESLSTLNFAKRAKNIKNRPVINEDIDHNTLINQYATECVRLRAELEEKNKIIASIEPILEQKIFEEKAKMDALKKYETASKQLFIERDEKLKLENKIKLMNLQMITGGHKNSFVHLNNSMSTNKIVAEEDPDNLDTERIKEQIKDSKAQEEAYKKLLYNQRDVMDGLKSTLFEKENEINQIQKENEVIKNKLNEINKISKLKDDYISKLESILDNNNIKFNKQNFQNIVINNIINDSINIPIKDTLKDDKIYIPYETEQNTDSNSIANPLTLLTSEEKIKELNDLVLYKNNEITLLKKVSEKIFSNANYTKNKKDNLFKEDNKNIKNEALKKLDEENNNLKAQIAEKNQIINLQLDEKEKLENYYSSIAQLNNQLEKENLIFLDIKENLISQLGGLIEKIDAPNYNENIFQSLRTDLVKIFQIVLNINSAEDSNKSISNFTKPERRQSEQSVDKTPKTHSIHHRKSNSLHSFKTKNNQYNNNVIKTIKTIKITSNITK